MKKTLYLLLILALSLNTGCKKDKKDAADDMDDVKEMNDDVDMDTNSSTNNTNMPKEIKKLKVALEARSNSKVSGNAVFTEENGVVTMIAVMDGLTAGSHAIHLHEKADCSAADGTSTGGHWNPTGQPHGKWGSANGYHKGDIGNFTADANGNGTISITTDEWCIGCGDANKNIVGKAIIVHEKADDFSTQPTGGAGGRVSCGGIIQ